MFFNADPVHPKEHENKEALQELLAIAPYPSESTFEKEMVIQNWMNKFSDNNVNEAASTKSTLMALFTAPEYSMSDLWRYFNGLFFSTNTLKYSFDVETLGFDFKVPVFFFYGRYDHNTSPILGHDYFEKIHAPFKEFVWFEKSAHFPMLEEPENFLKELIERVLPIAYKLHDNSEQKSN